MARVTVSQAKQVTINEFMSMSEKQQKAVTQALVDASNKRVQRAVEKGNAQTIETFSEHKFGKLSTKGKTGQELVDTFQQAKQTMSDTRTTQKGIEKATETKFGMSASEWEESLGDLWGAQKEIVKELGIQYKYEDIKESIDYVSRNEMTTDLETNKERVKQRLMGLQKATEKALDRKKQAYDTILS